MCVSLNEMINCDGKVQRSAYRVVVASICLMCGRNICGDTYTGSCWNLCTKLCDRRSILTHGLSPIHMYLLNEIHLTSALVTDLGPLLQAGRRRCRPLHKQAQPIRQCNGIAEISACCFSRATLEGRQVRTRETGPYILSNSMQRPISKENNNPISH